MGQKIRRSHQIHELLVQNPAAKIVEHLGFDQHGSVRWRDHIVGRKRILAHQFLRHAWRLPRNRQQYGNQNQQDQLSANHGLSQNSTPATNMRGGAKTIRNVQYTTRCRNSLSYSHESTPHAIRSFLALSDWIRPPCADTVVVTSCRNDWGVLSKQHLGLVEHPSINALR